jgi:hypothetical protein
MDSATLACCLFISFFLGCALFWSIHEFTREQARVFMPKCTIVESIPQEYECYGMYGRGPTTCKSNNDGWKIFVEISDNSMVNASKIPLFSEFWTGRQRDCCEPEKECVMISTIHMDSHKMSEIWFSLLDPINGCWFDKSTNRAYFKSDEKRMGWAWFLMIALHVFFGLDHISNGICCIRSSKITRIID